MNNDHINISEIETHLDRVIRDHICKNCFAGTLPATLTEGVATYAVIDSTNAIYDYEAYGYAIINIYLYAIPVKGMKNVAAMSKLEKSFSKALREDAFDNENYRVDRATAYSNSGYDNTYGMHFTRKAIRLTII